MSRSLVKFAAIIVVIAALLYVGLFGLDFTNTVRFPGITDSDGITQGLDLKGGTVIVFKAQTDSPSEDDMDTAVNMLRQRLDFQGYTEASVTQQGSDKIESNCRTYRIRSRRWIRSELRLSSNSRTRPVIS